MEESEQHATMKKIEEALDTLPPGIAVVRVLNAVAALYGLYPYVAPAERGMVQS